MLTTTTKQCALAVLAVVLAAPLAAPADEIIVDGVHYANVYVRESDSLYFIQTPTDGKIITAMRDTVTPGSVKFTENEAEREAILERWKGNNPRHQEKLAHEARKEEVKALAASSEAPGLQTPTLQLQGDGTGAAIRRMKSDGYIPYINLKDVPLKDALDGILRPMGLDYRVEGDIIFVSSPEILRRESSQKVETRFYQYNGNDTMHKIVLRNPFSVTGGGINGGSGFGGGFGGQSGFGGGGFGGQGGGFGGGGFGGQGGGGFGGGGFGGQGGGGFGGGGFGGQGGGFGGGGGSSDVTATSNISELFSNIDDRIVGEAPATIGGGYYAQPKKSTFKPYGGRGSNQGNGRR